VTHFAVFGYHVTGSTGTLFLYGIVVGALAVAGLGMLLAANLNGGNLLLEQQADIAGVLRLLMDRKVTHAVLVPTVLQRLLALPECKTTDWSALRSQRRRFFQVWLPRQVALPRLITQSTSGSKV
jgi:acyl-CoA synthetase (AMP-forming)/AMP-acid ligase II